MRLFLLLHAAVALAGQDPLREACPSLRDLQKEVFNCGDNDYAAKAAARCADTVIASWEAAAAVLAPTLKPVDSSLQRGSLQDTSADYGKTLRTLDTQISVLQFYTDQVASYPEMMMDFPEGLDDETSADCFNDAFHSVQKTVSRLDDEILRAKKLRELTVSLRKETDSRRAHLDGSLAGPAVKAAYAPSLKPVPGGRSPASSSDITGVRNDELKRAKP